MNKPVKQSAPLDKSATAVEIERLLSRIGEGGSVNSWTNGNGWVTCATVKRPHSTQTVRQYSEGASNQNAAELACLAAVKQAVGA